MDTLNINQEEIQSDSFETLEDNTQHITDVLVTQIILCIAILTGVFILNIFNPEVSSYIIDTFKHQTTVDFSTTLQDALVWLYDRVQS